MKIRNFIVVLVIVGQTLFAGEIDDAKKFLEKQVRQREEILISKKLQDILNASVIGARLGFYTDENSSISIKESTILKYDDGFKSFNSANDLIVSDEFLKSINPEFKLNSEENIAKFATLLKEIDSWSKFNKYFKIEEKLCFFAKSSFDEISYYQIGLNANGSIKNIEYVQKEMEIPESSKEIELLYFEKDYNLNQDDKVKITEILRGNLPTISYTIIKNSIKGLGDKIKLFDCKISISYIYDENSSSTTNSEFILLECFGNYKTIERKEKIFEDDFFKDAISNFYTIKTDNDAQIFEQLLDSIEPVDKFEKFHYKDGSVWYFGRKKFFDDFQGFLVYVDDGKITNITQSKDIKYPDKNQIFVDKSIKDAEEFLENSFKTKTQLFLSEESKKILNAEIINASRILDVNDSNPIAENLFLNHKNSLYKFKNTNELITSKEFVKAINPFFKLKKDENIVSFRKLLSEIDNNMSRGFFKEDDKICFVISKSFGEFNYYEVSIKTNGKISKIKLKEKEAELPKEADKYLKSYYKPKEVELNKKDLEVINSSLKKDLLEYSFKIVKYDIDTLQDNLEIYEFQYIVTEKTDEDYIQSSTQEYILIKIVDKYIIITDKNNLFENKEFLKAITSSYKIKSEKDAKKFEELIDSILPADNFEKNFYKQNSAWCFIREKSFEDSRGFIVIVNDSGEIVYIENSMSIKDSAIRRAKLKSSGEPLDYKFQLVKPENKKIYVNKDDEIAIEIKYNADAVNIKGAYIETKLDSKMLGFSASTEMVSPFKDEIPVEYIVEKYGKGSHIIEYSLKTNEEQLANIKIEIVIK